MKKLLLWAWLAVGLAIGLFVLAYQWYALNVAPIKHWAGFGATAAECSATFRPAALTITNRMLVSPVSRAYVKGGWSVIIGFDEQDHAEQFVISQSSLIGRGRALSAPEQTNLLAEFGNGSRWVYEGDNHGLGAVWERADEKAAASYFVEEHYMVLMNHAGMDRVRRLHNLPAPAAGHP